MREETAAGVSSQIEKKARAVVGRGGEEPA